MGELVEHRADAILVAERGLDRRGVDVAEGHGDIWVDVMGLSVGETRLDLRMERHDGDVTVRLLRRVGPGRVVIVR